MCPQSGWVYAMNEKNICFVSYFFVSFREAVSLIIFV